MRKKISLVLFLLLSGCSTAGYFNNAAISVTYCDSAVYLTCKFKGGK